MLKGLSPVVILSGFPAGTPECPSRTWYRSRPPSRLETKSSGCGGPGRAHVHRLLFGDADRLSPPPAGHHVDAAGCNVAQVTGADVLDVARDEGNPATIRRPGRRVQLPNDGDDARGSAVDRLGIERVVDAECEGTTVGREGHTAYRAGRRYQQARHPAEGRDELHSAGRNERQALSIRQPGRPAALARTVLHHGDRRLRPPPGAPPAHLRAPSRP